jgi:hypothetical protein
MIQTAAVATAATAAWTARAAEVTTSAKPSRTIETDVLACAVAVARRRGKNGEAQPLTLHFGRGNVQADPKVRSVCREAFLASA